LGYFVDSSLRCGAYIVSTPGNGFRSQAPAGHIEELSSDLGKNAPEAARRSMHPRAFSLHLLTSPASSEVAFS
jgi:hypothetical protein